MKGISFGDYHSYNAFGLILSSKEIGSPEPKIITIEVEGGDGVLDFTEFAGETKFKNRTLTFHFSKPSVLTNFMTLFSTVHNAIHGKKLHIVLDDDPNYYYIGRITVNEFKADANIGLITIECDCEPWKYKMNETIVTASVSGTRTVNLLNQRKSVVPTITASASMKYSFGNTSITVNAGTFKIPELELKAGINLVTITGTGTVIFRYQEGGL